MLGMGLVYIVLWITLLVHTVYMMISHKRASSRENVVRSDCLAIGMLALGFAIVLRKLQLESNALVVLEMVLYGVSISCNSYYIARFRGRRCGSKVAREVSR